MILIEYYDFIYHEFLRRLRNEQDAEDYTQELFIRYIKYHKPPGKKGMSIKFVKLLIADTWKALRTRARAAKRQGELSEYVDFAVPSVAFDYTFTKELVKLVATLPFKLIEAIYKLLTHDPKHDGRLDDKYMQRIRDNKELLLI